MTPSEAFSKFAHTCIIPDRCERFTKLTSSNKGHAKILKALCHDFDSLIRKSCIMNRSYDKIWDQPCFVFQWNLGFGVEYATIREAYDFLHSFDSWLILLIDGSLAIYRPEDSWDGEKLVGG